ncbi:LysR family transcriptional regulator [Promicromonospora sukumoe]|uniref:LysR family transcriptional regulator n=1 Tax=Promicromonospora sukumoe TaxID=88382 RepID=UPI0003643368|nr:LysR family transcriptional regulator [Promicromonospora sukumoe]
MDVVSRRVLPMLPVLAAFAETGQTLAAADVLQMPQSTVSRTLARLGLELGVPVVERHGRGIRLTPAGEALVPHAAAVLAAADAGVDAVRVQEPGARGTITIAFQGTLGERVVPALVRAFLREHPATRFELLQVSRTFCLGAVEDGTADVALISPLEEREGMSSLRLHVEPLVLVVPQGHRLATRPRVDFHEAAAETFVSMKPGYGMRSLLDRLAADAGFTPRVGFEGDELSTLRGLVSASLGVALAPRDLHGAPGCVEVPVTDAGAFREIGASWLDQRTTTLAAAFRTLLRRRGRRLTEIGLHHP